MVDPFCFVVHSWLAGIAGRNKLLINMKAHLQNRVFSSAQDDDTRGRKGSHLGDTLHVLELAVLYYDTSSPLEKGRAKGAGWMCRIAAPF